MYIYNFNRENKYMSNIYLYTQKYMSVCGYAFFKICL